MRKKFNERLDREIEAVKAYKTEAKGEDLKTATDKTPDVLITNGVTKVSLPYDLYQKFAADAEKTSAIKKHTAPYAITAEEFGEEEGYNSVSLYYYTEDEVVTDEADNELDNVYEILGAGALDIFVYTNAESCFIRNDAKRCDYEVIKHEGSFEDYSSGVMGDEDG
jgi:hypothetical protein